MPVEIHDFQFQCKFELQQRVPKRVSHKERVPRNGRRWQLAIVDQRTCSAPFSIPTGPYSPSVGNSSIPTHTTCSIPGRRPTASLQIHELQPGSAVATRRPPAVATRRLDQQRYTGGTREMMAGHAYRPRGP